MFALLIPHINFTKHSPRSLGNSSSSSKRRMVYGCLHYLGRERAEILFQIFLTMVKLVLDTLKLALQVHKKVGERASNKILKYELCKDYRVAILQDLAKFEKAYQGARETYRL